VDTIPAVVAAAADRFGDAEALVDGPVRLSWRQLHEQVRVAAAWFARAGVVPGDRVAICAPNTHHWVLAALGAQYAGATLVPVNTRFTAAETADLLERTAARRSGRGPGTSRPPRAHGLRCVPAGQRSRRR
jgi:acyl-CoA synthetase (AMP-forming)/AMP-acid ligase II